MTNYSTCCPECSSANVMFSKKRKLHICEDCGREFVLEKPFVPLRIFLSYGHDGNEELVRRIKADGEAWLKGKAEFERSVMKAVEHHERRTQ